MILTISTTHQPATDLGFLLMKHPENVHETNLPFGRAIVFYPEATDERCTAALMVEVDPIELVRGKAGAAGLQDQYVNDRPYAASSLLSVALGRSLGTALGGRSKHRQELADAPLPFEVTVSPIPARGDRDLLERLFAPLGYEVTAEQIGLDPARPDWGDSPYVRLTLKGTVKLSDLLAHLYVLVPVLDNNKHYFVGQDEVEKLLRRGEGWLDTHPERDLIIRRYLKGFRSLVKAATAGLEETVDAEEPEAAAERDAVEDALERPIRLNDERLDRVAKELAKAGAGTVVDLGCGEGKLLQRLLGERGFSRVIGVEVAPRVLARASDRLRLEHMPDLQRKRIELLQGSLVYRDDRLAGFDAAAVVEVIEHMDADRLPAFEAAVFVHARPRTVIITTPNREYNVLFESLGPDKLRHPDHRFEWTRSEFEGWAKQLAERNGYRVEFDGIGPAHAEHGSPTQMGVFTQC